TPMTEEDWAHDSNHLLGMLFDGTRPMLLLLNGGGRSRAFVLPERPAGAWTVVLDTAHDDRHLAETGLTLAPHSLLLLHHP
ncbi:MAG: hypothetical protein ABI860_07635, partial [Gemmatimonadales bacterium]